MWHTALLMCKGFAGTPCPNWNSPYGQLSHSNANMGQGRVRPLQHKIFRTWCLIMFVTFVQAHGKLQVQSTAHFQFLGSSAATLTLSQLSSES